MAETEYLIYENLFAKKEDIEDFVLEGKADITFENGCMRMKNALEAGLGQMANFVLWCPKEFPKDIRVEWEFRPLSDVGLCILFLQQREKETGICSIRLLLKEQGSIRSITAVISMRSMSPIFAEKSRRRGYFIHVIFVKAADFILLPKGRIRFRELRM